MDKKQETIDTYNRSARGLADKFNAQGARAADIEETFRVVTKSNPKVLEIGCGNGRDAEEILKRTNDYLGMDISEQLINIAKENVPGGHFKVADIEGFQFSENFDIIFAFASLIHVPKESLKKILERSYASLNNGGVMRISLKYSDAYMETTKEDKFGVRTYYLYSQSDIQELAKGFTIARNEIMDVRDQKWLEVLLVKNVEKA
jgi:trans-aconitate methyltransferase